MCDNVSDQTEYAGRCSRMLCTGTETMPDPARDLMFIYSVCKYSLGYVGPSTLSQNSQQTHSQDHLPMSCHVTYGGID
jgi:hypothetical protein